MANTKKELYLGKALKDLNEMAAKKKILKIPDQQCRAYTKSGDKVYRSAMDELLVNHDEEKAYLLLMRFLDICIAIRKTAEYKKDPKYYDPMVVNKMVKAMDDAEKLSESLKQRYEEKEALEISKQLDNLDVNEKQPTTSDQSEPSELNNKDKPMEESSTDHPIEKVLGSKEGLIGVNSLYSLLIDDDTSLLIMDVRSIQDFNASHLMHKSCINIPHTVIKPGCISRHIEAELSGETKEAWQSRGRVDFVIVVDWNSDSKLFETGSPVKSLKDAIFKWEQDVIVKSEPLLLEGGYSDWLTFYPQYSTNPHVQTPNINNDDKPIVSLDEIGYDLDFNFLNSPEDKTPLLHPIQNGNVAQISQPDLNNRPPDPNRALKPSSQDSILMKKVSNNSNRILPSGTNVDTFSGVDVKIIRNDLSNGMELGENPIPNGITPPTSIHSNLQISRSKSSTPDIPNRTLKPKDSSASSQATSQATSQSSLDRLTGEIISEQQILEADKAALERERAELQEKMKHEQEQYERLRMMKNNEARETAILMRKKKEVERSIQSDQSRAAVKPGAAHAEKARLDRLKIDEKEEEERMQIAMQRLNAEAEAEKVQKDLDEKKRRLEERENDIQEKMKAEKQRRKELKDKQDAVKRQQDEKEAEKMRKQNEERKRQTHLERLRLDKQRQIEREKQEKSRIEEQEIERQRLENERILKAKDKSDAETIEKNRKEAEKALLAEKERREMERVRLEMERERRETEIVRLEMERRRAENEKAALEKLRKDKVERDRQMAEAENTRKAAVKASNASLPSGWEKRFDSNSQRFFYLDHATKKSQWENPSSASMSQGSTDSSSSRVYKAPLRGEDDISSSSSGLKRSYSSPNIAKMMADEEQRQIGSPTPSVDRAAKPKPISSRTMLPPSKIRNFDGVWGNVGTGLTGLKNMGNTCYMNSTLQCLSNTGVLASYLLSDSYMHDINRENKHGTRGELADEFAEVVRHLWSSHYRSITPRDFKHTAGKHNSMFAGYEQLDSQEFLLILLDSLHEDLNKVRNRPRLEEQKNDGVDDEVAGGKAWMMHKTVHDSIMVELFQGQYKSTVTCTVCEKRSVTFDTFMYLSLDIPAKNRATLDSCLLNFSSEEAMTGDSRWNCPRCRTKRDAVKRIVIWKLPPITIIVLKRFYYKGMRREKISTAVDFPLDNLDLNRYASGPKKRGLYNLYAVTNHYGTLDGGHYTAFCKNPMLNKWFKFDDHEVYETSKSSVKSPAAYFLFYSCMNNTMSRK